MTLSSLPYLKALQADSTPSVTVPHVVPWTKREKRAYDAGWALGEASRLFQTVETDSDTEAVKRADGYKAGRDYGQTNKGKA